MTSRAVRAALGVAAVYGYFLIFAQFSFVELMRSHGVSTTGEKTALGLMAAAGIAGGFLATRVRRQVHGLRAALAAAAACALGSRLCQGPTSFLPVAAATGASLGAATVWMAALLPRWCGVIWAGIGTGVGYALCNIPPIFTADPEHQASIAAVFAGVGMLAVPRDMSPSPVLRTEATRISAWAMIAVFLALVWLDSAAFFIIQHSGELKSPTWGDGHLWRNSWVHLASGVLAGWLLQRGRLVAVAGTSWMLLAFAALAVNSGETRHLAGWVYPAAVSMYSTALIVWPGWFSGAGDRMGSALRAAWLFAIAGWFGSANGIGMAETLRHVPAMFVAASGVVVGAVLWVRRAGWQSVAAAGFVAAVAWASPRENGMALRGAPDPLHGRDVYRSEGCIHCHSRFTRPGTADELIWGGAGPLEETTAESPVLIGNRRQGPDLAHVGARRSEGWLREHFLAPRILAPDSTMPSYAHLFHDRRGDDLVAYLKLSGIDSLPDRMRTVSAWRPADVPASGDGGRLFGRHCAACHGRDGMGDGELASRFLRPPANLRTGPFLWTAGDDEETKVMRVIKFGIPGTDMPGHEVLDDADLRALAGVVLEFRHATKP